MVNENTSNIDFLKNIYFFHSMPDSSLQKICKLCNEVIFPENTVLFNENTPGNCFYIILEGELEIWKHFGLPDELLLGVSKVGQAVGEMALIDSQPRSATVRTRNQARLLVLEASIFNALLLTDINICATLLRSVTLMVRKSNEAHIADLDRQNKVLERANVDLKAAQDELINRERLSVLGRFSSLILHDIRNPLSAIKSRIEIIMLSGKDFPGFEQNIKKINRDISRMEMISAEFLDYARGDIRLNLIISDIGRLFERLKDSISVRAERSSVRLFFHNSVMSQVIVDEDRLLRVLINAGENACKAMPVGGDLTFSAFLDRQKLIFEITDTGEGMSPEVLSHIFEPFYSSSSAGGTGLGMIIIKSIIDAHQGTLEVFSEEGKGTRLFISLPLPKAV